MSHHDHHVGDTVAHQVPPGGSEDPEPYSTGYFVLWGFVLLLAMVVGLQYFAWNAQAIQSDRTAGHTNLGPAAELRVEQHRRLGARVESSMKEIVREHGSK